jgi:hypothetical protein
MVAMCLYVVESQKTQNMCRYYNLESYPVSQKNERKMKSIIQVFGFERETAKVSHFNDVHTAQATRKQPHLETPLALAAVLPPGRWCIPRRFMPLSPPTTHHKHSAGSLGPSILTTYDAFLVWKGKKEIQGIYYICPRQ